MSHPTCKALLEARQVEHSLAELSVRMRRLRRALRRCKTCPQSHCPLLRAFSAAVHTAIAELSEEWNL